MSEARHDAARLRAELAELRAQNAELRLARQLFTEQTGALLGLKDELLERNRLLVERDRLREEETRLLREENRLLAGRVAELERRSGQNPRNSHRPPSSEGYDKPAPRSRRGRTDRPSGGQPGHEGTTLHQVDTPDEVVTHAPARCAGCGGGLGDAPVASTERRQVFDLPRVAPWVVEHRVEHRVCGCGRVTMAEVPAGVAAPTQYGPRVRAVATYLLAGQHLPLARTAELLAELFGAPVSQGSLTGWYADAAAGLDPFLDAVRAGLAAADVLGADETGARVDGGLAWLHTARSDTLTLYTAHQGRGARGEDAMRAAGVLPALQPDQVLVHDCWGPYWNFDVTHALCGAHLLRELTAAAEVDGQAGWADGMDRLLCEINRTVSAARPDGADRLAPYLLAAYRRRYQTILAGGWAANPDHHTGQRGRRRRPKHVNLLDRLDTHRDEVLRFATDLRVPFTNNGSERDIRPTKIRLKVAGCLRTMAGAKAFCRLRSYLSTAAKQGQSRFEVLTMLHDGNPWLPATVDP